MGEPVLVFFLGGAAGAKKVWDTGFSPTTQFFNGNDPGQGNFVIYGSTTMNPTHWPDGTYAAP